MGRADRAARDRRPRPPGARPFRGRPTREQWQQLIDSLVARHDTHPFDLVVIDPLAAFLPGRTENDAGTMLDVLLPLQALTGRQVGVMIPHHPKKGPTADGQAARGGPGPCPGRWTSCWSSGWWAGRRTTTAGGGCRGTAGTGRRRGGW